MHRTSLSQGGGVNPSQGGGNLKKSCASHAHLAFLIFYPTFQSRRLNSFFPRFSEHSSPPPLTKILYTPMPVLLYPRGFLSISTKFRILLLYINNEQKNTMKKNTNFLYLHVRLEAEGIESDIFRPF